MSCQYVTRVESVAIQLVNGFNVKPILRVSQVTPSPRFDRIHSHFLPVNNFSSLRSSFVSIESPKFHSITYPSWLTPTLRPKRLRAMLRRTFPPPQPQQAPPNPPLLSRSQRSPRCRSTVSLTDLLVRISVPVIINLETELTPAQQAAKAQQARSGSSMIST